MSAGHTPGPWVTRSALKENEIDIRPAFRGVGKTPSQGFVGFRPIATVKRDKRLSAEESQANAALIASAPDLLAERDRLKAANAELAAACEAFVDYDEGAGTDMDDMQAMFAYSDARTKCRAALTKHHESQQ